MKELLHLLDEIRINGIIVYKRETEANNKCKENSNTMLLVEKKIKAGK